MPPGLQAAQCTHAAILFMQAFRDDSQAWYEESNNLVLLQVPDEKALRNIYDLAQKPKVLFLEPDLNNKPTAMALMDKKITSNLPLLLK
jgi:hypothetical protein